MGLFSFLKKKPKPQRQVTPVACTVAITTRRTATAYSWTWKLARPAKIPPPQVAALDSLIRELCTANAARENVGVKTQVLHLVIPV